MDIINFLTQADCISFPVAHTPFYHSFEPWRIMQTKLDNTFQNGVYVVLAGKPIPRFLQEDDQGILYIGKGQVLQQQHRLGKLINALNETERMHSAGIRYNMEKIKKSFPLEQVSVRIKLCDNPRKIESELLQSYLEQYGELPPFNHSL